MKAPRMKIQLAARTLIRVVNEANTMKVATANELMLARLDAMVRGCERTLNMLDQTVRHETANS